MSHDQEKNHLLEGEHDLLLDHDYDGIQELDHPLPNWWAMTFYGGIVFAVFYFLFYVVLGGPTLYEEYQKELARLDEVRAEMLANADYFELEEYQSWVAENNGVQRGEVVYMENCMACHLEKGQGDIGPNLTDNYWIHGDGLPENAYKIVANGVEEQGMPPWKDFLSREDMYAVVAYVQTLRNTFAEGKEPQGERVEE